jgi:hypothetical protein
MPDESPKSPPPASALAPSAQESSPVSAPPTNQPPAASAPPAITDEELKRALGAFKKRLKLTKLDQESSLGAGRPLTSGKKSDIMSIIPPNQFPRAVWNELARRGQLRDTGGGFFSLP